MKNTAFVLLTLLAFLVLAILSGAFYTVDETEQVILTQFGRPVGGPVTNAGLKVKIPLIQDVNRLEKRALAWDGRPTEMPTKDKTYLIVDSFARWQIRDPQTFFLRLRDERSASSRLDDILGSEIRNAVANHELIEIVRSTKDRQPRLDDVLTEAGAPTTLLPIKVGREAVERIIFENAVPKLASFGIDLLNVQFKRINYNDTVVRTIYQRMISERQQIAERFRSEGAGSAARILGDMQRDLKSIESEAYRTVQETRGKADAHATEIYAAAYNQSPAASELYQFTKTLETWQTALDSNTTVILSTDSELFRLLKAIPALPADERH